MPFSTKRSYTIKQTCSWNLQVYLTMCDLLVDIRHYIVNKLRIELSRRRCSLREGRFMNWNGWDAFRQFVKWVVLTISCRRLDFHLDTFSIVSEYLKKGQLKTIKNSRICTIEQIWSYAINALKSRWRWVCGPRADYRNS